MDTMYFENSYHLHTMSTLYVISQKVVFAKFDLHADIQNRIIMFYVTHKFVVIFELSHISYKIPRKE